MNHEEALNQIAAYIDNELSISEADTLAKHIADCKVCQLEYETQINTISLVKKNANYFEATPMFLSQLDQSIHESVGKSTPKNVIQKRWNINFGISWANIGTMMISLIALVWSTSLFLAIPNTEERLTDELISSHVRSLQVDHLSDVISTDKHTVKPWFNGKVDFSPSVIDFAESGFPLEGGRLDYVNGKTVAVLIYRHNKHAINLYVWPENNKDHQIKEESRHGFNAFQWVYQGMQYWMISDLEEGKLESFANRVQDEIIKSRPQG